MNLLITITASTLEELQWRIQEMKKLLISQDMNLHSCYFLQEQGFLSSLPLANLDKKLFKLSKGNHTLAVDAHNPKVPWHKDRHERSYLQGGRYR